MASSIGGNFSIPGQNHVQPNRNPGAAKPKEEVAVPGDQVELSAPQAPVSQAPARSTSTAPSPAEDGSWNVGVSPRSTSTVRNSPDRLLMGISDVQSISSYQAPADGSGISGLNSLQSVISTGVFQGLSGEYGQRNMTFGG